MKAYEDSFVEWFNNESTLTHSFEKDLNPPRISVQNLIIVSPNRRKKDIKMSLCLSNPMWKRYYNAVVSVEPHVKKFNKITTIEARKSETFLF